MARNTEDQTAVYRVLFVCTANICRSPMAMGLLRSLVSEESELWQIDSAGTWAQEGLPAARNTQHILERMSFPISSHRSRTVTLEMLKSYNLILTMERGHKEALRVEFPGLADRIYMLSEMIGASYDIEDPIGGPLVEFEEMASEVERILEEGLGKIRSLAKEDSIGDDA